MAMPAYADNQSWPRLWAFYFLFGLLFLILAGGLFYHQILQGEEYARQEMRQNFRRILLPGPRGNIYDREGRLLVGNRPLFQAVIYLNELRREFREEYIAIARTLRGEVDLAPGQKLPYTREQISAESRRRVVQRYLDKLNRILDLQESIPTEIIERHFAQKLLLPLPLLKDLSESQFARLIEQLPVDSPIQILTDYARYYPEQRLAAHTLGFVVSSEVSEGGLPGEELRTFKAKGRIGVSGLEKYFDDFLQGETGGEIWVVDPSGFQYKRTAYLQPKKGQDLHTSLDLDLQKAAGQAMQNYVGACVALDIQTGEVLVLLSRPDYDLNLLSPFLPTEVDRDIRARGAWLNRATQGLYPPGSTFKIITALAGLRSGENGVQPVDCQGFLTVGGRRFHCHYRAGHGWESLEHALRDSCNVFFYHHGLAIGPQAIASEALRFGLGQPTGIELPAEASKMLVPDPAWKQRRFREPWYAGDTANLAIGQGYLLQTPLQIACLAASLARGETRTRPTLLLAGNAHQPVTAEKIGLPPDQLQRIFDGMELSARQGTGKFVSLPGIRIAAKTGTAQVLVEGRELTIAWIMSFAPIEAPRLAVVVMIEGTDPGDNYHGGTAAAPVAREVFRKYFEKKGK